MAPSLPAQPPVAAEPRWGRALALFVLTCVTTTGFGTGFYLATRTDVVTDLVSDPALLLLGEPGRFVDSLVLIPWTVWTRPDLLRIGLMYSVPLMLILLAHELGHYLACRRHRIPCTLPYFLPAPLLLGTFGAFIRIRGRIESRRQLLDIGAAGPIAGFVVLLPFLVYGSSHSHLNPILEVDFGVGGDLLYVPGKSLLTWTLTAWEGLSLQPGTALDLHPFALAAWVGMLVTSLNLIPAGQLDGGHILYAVSPLWYRRLRPAVVVALLLLGFAWPGWWVWSGIVALVARRRPRLLYPHEALDTRGRGVALAAGLILLLTFMVVPISIIAVLS